MGIHLKNISKSFGDYNALDQVSLDIRTGELIALLGPSGSGKTTLLRIIVGLEKADSGEVLLDGEHSESKDVRNRNVGFVFQHYALFRHMTVFENVAFGLRVRPAQKRPTEIQIRRKVLSLLKLVHLEGLHNRYPNQLSGGQRQRVALARALAVEPQVLLLDEPFGALDAKVRKELRRWMRRLHDDMPITSVFVTHDQEEAMEVADRVVVMSNGRIEQVGAPDEVWNKPANAFVYDFLGNYNSFSARRDEGGGVVLDGGETGALHTAMVNEPQESAFFRRYPLLNTLLKVVKNSPKHPLISIKKAQSRTNLKEKPIKIFARPHEMALTRIADGDRSMAATLLHVNPAGPLVKLELEREGGGDIVQVELPMEEWLSLNLQKGDKAYVRPRSFKVFD